MNRRSGVFFIAFLTVEDDMDTREEERRHRPIDENSGVASLPAIDHHTSTPFHNRYIQVLIFRIHHQLWRWRSLAGMAGRGLRRIMMKQTALSVLFPKGTQENTRQKKHTNMLSYCRCAVGKGRKTEEKGAEGGRGRTKTGNKNGPWTHKAKASFWYGRESPYLWLVCFRWSQMFPLSCCCCSPYFEICFAFVLLLLLLLLSLTYFYCVFASFPRMTFDKQTVPAFHIKFIISSYFTFLSATC